MNQDCVICFESVTKNDFIRLTCNHVFHKNCIIKLIEKRSRKCPLCRHRITWTVNSIKSNNYIKKRHRKSNCNIKE